MNAHRVLPSSLRVVRGTSRLFVFLACFLTLGTIPADAAEDPDPQAKVAIEQFTAGPSVFIENQGQWPDDSIRFALDASGANVGLTDQGPRFQLFRKAPQAEQEHTLSLASESTSETEPSLDAQAVDMHEFRLFFHGASAVAPTGRGLSCRKFNYLIGDVANHRQAVRSYESVWYDEVFPGIALELQGQRSGLKYNFHLAPGADWRAIRLQYDGIDGLSLRDDGTLEIRIVDGWDALTDGAPCIYQEINGAKRGVAGRYTLLDDHTYGFEVTGAYDIALPLVIDPEVAWGTYLGGSASDKGYGIAVDSGGNCYLTGETASSGWVSGGWDAAHGGGSDGYVVKLDASSTHLWSTYLGGSGDDFSYAIVADSSGSCYATGYTYSSGWVSGGWDTTHNGSYDGFVVKLDASGAHQWSTYVGGSNPGRGFGVAVDSSGSCYATGCTYSPGWVSGGWDTTHNGGWDGYIVKLDTSGTHLWSTYLGGSDSEYSEVGGIAVDSSGNCYATGNTSSSGWVSGGWDTTHNGAGDSYVVKLDASGAHQWSTYLGGSGTELGYGIAADSSGNCYATGYTASLGWVTGGWDTAYSGIDSYVVKLDTSGAHQWSTYLGGLNGNVGGIAADSSGNCYATGYTSSSGWVSGGGDISHNGGTDSFIVKLDASGAHVWSSYLGGSSTERGYAIAVDSSGNCYATGYTYSSGWVDGGWDTTHNGSYDGYAIKIADTVAGSLQVTLTPPGAIAAGAQWRRRFTTTWLNSGDTESGVPAGQWNIEFKDALGYALPTTQSVAVPTGGTAAVTGAYVAADVGISWGTYLGDLGYDGGYGIAVDSGGNCYATGQTQSSGWVSSGWNTSHGGSNDAYVAKLDASGTHLWSTYMGGASGEIGYGIAVDSGGNCYATGNTSSSGWVSGGWDTTHNGSTDGYVVKLDTSGAHLWSTYLGGSNYENGFGIAVDSSGNCYATGQTESSGWVSGGWDTTYKGGRDSYIVKLDASGTHLWSTYMGGASVEIGYGIAADSSGNCYATGQTQSSGWVSGGWDTSLGGSRDGYVVKLDGSGAHQWSTYLGGSGVDHGSGIAVDSSGNCYATGQTESSGWVSSGWDTSLGGSRDGYVVKLDALGAHQWSTYLGGSGADSGGGIAADSSGNCYATGQTASSDWVSGGWDTTLGGTTDAYVLKLDTLGAHQWSSYLGGWNADYGSGMAVDSSGNCYTTGRTESSGWLSGGWDTTYGGTTDGYVVKIGKAPPTVPGNPGSTSIGTDTITWTWQDNSSSETGFKVYDDPGSSSPTTLQTTTPADTEQWQHNGLNVNTQYTFQVCATNADGDSVKTSDYTAWTLAEVPVAPVVNNPTGHTLDVAIGAAGGNPAGTVYAIQISPNVGGNTWVQTGGSVGASAAYQTAALWATTAVSGLTEATAYIFSVTAQNGAGVDTAPGPGTSLSTLDVTPPSITLTSTAGDPVGTAITVNVAISENTTDFTSGDITPVNATVGSFSGSGSSYSFTLTPSASGTFGASVGAASFTDEVGNGNTASNTLSRTADLTLPSITLTSTAGDPVGTAITVNVAISENTTDFTSGDITPVNATVGSFSGSGSSYSFTLTPSASGTFSASVGPASFTDEVGNGNTASNTLSRTADLTPPTISLTSTAGDPVGTAITVNVAISENTTNFTSGDITPVNATVGSFSGSGSSFSFTLTPSASGTFSASVGAASFTDEVGNGNTASNTLSRTADLTPPTISLTSTAGDPVSAAINVDVVLSENSIDFMAEDITSENAMVDGFSGSGSSYSFTLTPSTSGTFSASVGAASFTDEVGNANTPSNTLSRTYVAPLPFVSWPLALALTLAATAAIHRRRRK